MEAADHQEVSSVLNWPEHELGRLGFICIPREGVQGEKGTAVSFIKCLKD